ncbi:trypsin-2-like [Littorina saxatilis]|uniref:Peptidase S1 domain-containing protein n=1 Tax=Littorina saxatilis TaxID=31220 RepID=A0AAN9AW76_9CAEN
MTPAVVLSLTLALVSSGFAATLKNNVLNDVLQQYLRQSGAANTERPTGRIIGGDRVIDRCVAPFNAMVALQLMPNNPDLKVTYCSGVMLSPDLIVTAGICLFPYLSFEGPVLTAVIGEKHFDFQDDSQVNVLVRNFKIHPTYDSVIGDNNIGLIKLDSPVTLNDCVQPIMRFVRDPTTCSSTLMNCTITGWGQSDENGDLTRNAKNPMYGMVRLVDENLSVLLSSKGTYTTPLRQNSLYAIAYPNSPLQACLLDWGGMVACNMNGDWMLRGVIGEHNCIPPGTSSGPIVITNLEKFASWINSCSADFNSAACQAYKLPQSA